ncbi:MAG TPA: NAD(P)H-dependent oxidoreductase subunit E [Dehalococcoidales bacterium]
MVERRIGAPIPDRPPDSHNLLFLLGKAQSRFGYLPENLLCDISNSLGIALGDVYGVATFYSFFSVQEQGRHVIRICKSLPCFIKKSQHIINVVEDATGVKLGTTSPNARFSIQLVNCIGECDKAPTMMIDGRVYVDLTPHKISRILKDYE